MQFRLFNERVTSCKTGTRRKKRRIRKENEQDSTEVRGGRAEGHLYRAGLETESAGSLREHKDGGGLGGKAPTLGLPQRRAKREVRGRE